MKKDYPTFRITLHGRAQGRHAVAHSPVLSDFESGVAWLRKHLHGSGSVFERARDEQRASDRRRSKDQDES